ncbi:hypothetical protein [Methanobacterium spitsbergense]|uniref:Lipoprotein n=1 Tax=Methanobacterium spitsbergense TaxID=2874285 RepID=A0A8T5UZP4_9EURY|nr:hypothetical protein [Methanobacterium spitsbergense]MBZ2166640.1 hypothetical protein [Methanobacterium spitsbergense]
MKKLLMGGIFLILAVVLVSGCTSSGNNTQTAAPINVTNVTAGPGEFGMYTVTAAITPNENLDYLEMVAIWYDSSNAVIQTSSLLWNVNNPQAGQVYKAKGEDSLYQKGTPTRVEIYIFDSVFSGGDTSKAIYHHTVTFK